MDGFYSCGTFFDFSKAFDTVNHDILIKKLEHYGFRRIFKDWFWSYLKDRKQYVSIANILSDYKQISCGVPQVSVLEPLLFLLYVNEFKNYSNLFDFHLFADDSNLFYTNKNLSTLESNVNKKNYMKFTIGSVLINSLLVLKNQTMSLFFSPPLPKKINYTVNLKINNQSLKHEKNINYIGILIDSHLNWKSQVSYLANKN